MSTKKYMRSLDRKTDYDIKAKGNKSWTQYRLETMREVTANLIVKPAKAVSSRCKVIMKMANWYDQYAGPGNDTEKVPFIADGMFSGTESRLWVGQEQPLQPNLSHEIMRFMAIADIEIAIIDAKTNVREFQQQLRTNEVHYALRKGWTI
ncbi:MAG: hypothetical protein ACLQVX_12860 [Limisphaerales bacterium]